MKTILTMSVMAALNVSAATFTYSWISDGPLPPPTRPGFHRVTASGSFVVDAKAVGSGQILPGDVLALDFKMSSPANYIYHAFDSGALIVNTSTGEILSGELHALDVFSTYGHGCRFFGQAIVEDNALGGSWHGHWQITKSP